MNTLKTIAGKSLARVSMLLGTATGAFALLGTLFEAMENPLYRFVTWGFAACCFGASYLIGKSTKSIIVDPDGNSIVKEDPWRVIYIFGFLAFASLLIADVAIINFRRPIDFNPDPTIFGTRDGLTKNKSDNPLIEYEVSNINPVVDRQKHESFPYSGPYAMTLIKRRRGVDQVLFHKFSIRVVRFEEMTDFNDVGAGGGSLDTIDTAFLLTRKASALPWKFEPTHSRSITNGVLHDTANGFLPFYVDDDNPFAVRLFINARDPGIYWVECNMEVGDGISTPKEFSLFDDPIPIAFFGVPPAPIANTQFTAETKLAEIEQEIEWLKSGEYVMVPRRNEEIGAYHLKSLKDARDKLKEQASTDKEGLTTTPK